MPELTSPVAVQMSKATALTGLSRSRLYREAAAGNIRLMKAGRTTLVDLDSVRAFLARLPAAALNRSDSGRTMPAAPCERRPLTNDEWAELRGDHNLEARDAALRARRTSVPRGRPIKARNQQQQEPPACEPKSHFVPPAPERAARTAAAQEAELQDQLQAVMPSREAQSMARYLARLGYTIDNYREHLTDHLSVVFPPYTRHGRAIASIVQICLDRQQVAAQTDSQNRT